MHTFHTDQFWLLVDNAVKATNGDDALKEKYLTAELEKRSLDEIKNFEIVFRQCVIDADDFKVMAAQKIITNYVSDDSYLYFRCWLIGQGREVYTETLKNPDYLAKIINIEDMCSWEGIMYVHIPGKPVKKKMKPSPETLPLKWVLTTILERHQPKALTGRKSSFLRCFQNSG